MIFSRKAGISGNKKKIHKKLPRPQMTRGKKTMPGKVNIALDMDELKEIMDNDMDLIQECFEDFLSDCPLLLEDIKNAIGQKDFQQIEESAHKLKGGLKYLAAGSAVNARHPAY
jgi:hypothetical protein